MNTKNLHRHSLPIIMLAALVFVISATTLNQYDHSVTAIYGRALLGHAIIVKPSKNGLAHLEINRHPVADEAAPTKPVVIPASIINNSGQSAQLQVLLTIN